MNRIGSLASLPALLVACLFVLVAWHSAAGEENQAQNLFKPIPQAKSAGLSADQQERLDQIRKKSGTLDVQQVEINMGLFRSKSMNLNMKGDAFLNAKTHQVEKRSENDFTWIGRIQDPGGQGSAILVVKDGLVTGTVQTDGELYEIVPLGQGRHAIVHVDQSKFPPDEPPEFKQIEKQLQPAPKPESRDLMDKKDRPRPGGPYVIRVLVAYTPEARDAAGGKAGMENKIQLAVSESNQSYTNSNINIKLELAHQYEVNYKETGKIETDLKRFREKGDNYMDDAHALRDKHRGSVAVLIVKTAEYCGLASGIGANADNAFCAVKLDCMTGNYSFAHEIGHLQGARHNWEADGTQDSTHRANHASWHVGEGKTDSWRTIMAYPCPDNTCPRILHWSSPRSTRQEVPMGTSDCCDNAAILNSTAEKVSRFK